MKDRKVLILEDDDVIYRQLTRLLHKMGFVHIFAAKSHTQAVALASDHHFDIMLSVVKIEDGYDGIDAAKVLQQMYDTAVIFLCTHSDDEIISRLVEVKIIGYLIKPFREEALQTLITLAIIKAKAKEPSAAFKIVGAYTFNVETSLLSKDTKAIRLSKKEQLFFSLYFRSLEFIVPYSVIDETIWPQQKVKVNTRRTFLYRIRKRFPDLPFKIVKDIGIIPN